MKILKIFGAIVAINSVFFVLLFSIPGCSSTNKPVMTASAPPAGPVPVITVPGGPEGGPGGTGFEKQADPATFLPNVPSPVLTTPRYSPTRPGTPAASAVLAQPVADVTPVTTYTVVTNDNLTNVAKKNHTTIKDLAAANSISPTAKLKLGQKLIIPGQALGGTSASMPASDAAQTYRVQPLDTLASIAKRAHTTIAVLKNLNNLKSDVVRAGQELKLPPATLMRADDPAAVSSAESGSKPPSGAYSHVVKPHETLGSIAQMYQVKQSEIALANNITNPALIKAGMTLIIPGWQAPKSAKAGDSPSTTSGAKPSGVGSAAPQNFDSAPPASTPSDVPVIKVEDSPSPSAPKNP